MQRAIILSCLLLSGCASIPTVDTPLATVSERLRGVELAVIPYQEPKMIITTPGDLGPGLVDGLTDLRGIDRSEQSVSSILANALTERLASKASLDFEPDVRRGSPLQHRQLDANTPVRNSLEIAMTANFVGYRPTAWRTYQYMLHAQARLTDGSGSVVWKKRCKIGGSAADEALQFARSDDAELNRAGLSRVVQAAVDRCAREMTDGAGT